MINRHFFCPKDKSGKGRPAFTLVEILITLIIIIGSLAGIAIVTVSPSRDKAEATRIVSGLKTLSRAADMGHADTNAWPSNTNDLQPPLDGKLCETGRVCYQVVDVNDTLYLHGYFGERVISGFRDRLASMPADLGLNQSNNHIFITYANSHNLYYRLRPLPRFKRMGRKSRFPDDSYRKYHRNRIVRMPDQAWIPSGELTMIACTDGSL